uniref:Protein wntless homolog n=1 Tax=Phallusia mammillata TaxID=59560 RepID=A0A6F9DY10_9ASCI|nr:protein wntless homolog [Phallusia mammillata]
MAGALVETLSTKKLLAVFVGFILLEIGFIILAKVKAPISTMAIVQSAVTCIDNKSQDWILPETCKYMVLDPENHQETISHQGPDDNPTHDPNNVVFAAVLPKKIVEMSRWFQYMLTLAVFKIPYNPQLEVAPDAVATLDIRLAYSNNKDFYKLPKSWQSVVNSTQERPLECVFEHPKTDEYKGFHYNCDPLFILQLGSLPHKHYLINIRLPVNKANPKISPNMKIGQVTEIDFVSITQTGGFTKIWISLKVALCTIMIFPLIWYWRRVTALARPALLIEKAIFGLALGMEFLNIPLELVTIFSDASWMLLFTDIRQGLFYALIFIFWVIFTGEHLMDQAHRNKLSSYKWQLGCITVSCLAFLGFELGERGTQLVNPTATMWQHPNLALALLVCGCIAGVLYFLLLCYLVFRVFRSIRFKRRFVLPTERTAHFQSIVNRFRMLMLLSAGTAGLTVAFFILQQKLEGMMNHYLPEDYEFNMASGFFTGVYGLWNIYVFLVLSLYAPSHKLYITSDLDNGDHSSSNGVATEQVQLMQMTQEKPRED